MGICTVVKEGYPDFTAFDPKDMHFDPKSKKDNPTWYMVDIKLEKEFNLPITLTMIKENPRLKNMKLLQRGNRLSVMPIAREEFDEIVKLGMSK
jgi:predicted RNA-binding protein with PUA-like domain